MPEQANNSIDEAALAPTEQQGSSLITISSSDKQAELPANFTEHEYLLKYSPLSTVTMLFTTYIAMFLLFSMMCVCAVMDITSGIPVAFLVPISFGVLVTWIFSQPIAPLRLSSKGAVFSKYTAFTLHNRLERSWEDLHSIHLALSYYATNEPIRKLNHSVDQLKWSKNTRMNTIYMLQLDFTSGGHANIPLSMLTRRQCECLFLALEAWVSSSKLSNDLIKMKHAVIADDKSLSFTNIWMQDMEQRYTTTNFTPLIAGKTLGDGRYTVASILSTRGQTAAYLVKDRDGNQLVAKEFVSFSARAGETQEKARELFHREAQILMKLHHPQVARVVDCFVESGRDYVLLEYVQGRTLRQLVKLEGARNADDVVRWTNELIDVLDYLHSCDPPILHRDLTPDNIVVKNDGSLVVIDFGAANEFIGNATGTLIGKQSYVAPEQFRGKAEPASDIYSLGASAFYLLTASDPMPLAESVPSSQAKTVPPELDSFVSRCTKFDTTERVRSAQEARELLKQLTQTTATRSV